MKPAVLVVALFSIASPAPSSEQGTTVVLDTRASSLKPGTRVTAVVSAEYQIAEPPFRAKKPREGSYAVTDESIRYRLRVKSPIVWEFTVGANGEVPTGRLELEFPKPIAPPPPGMLARVAFPVHCTIAEPDRPPRVRQYEFSVAVEAAMPRVISRCVKLWRVGEDRFGMGVLKHCDWDPAKDPNARTIRMERQ